MIKYVQYGLCSSLIKDFQNTFSIFKRLYLPFDWSLPYLLHECKVLAQGHARQSAVECIERPFLDKCSQKLQIF